MNCEVFFVVKLTWIRWWHRWYHKMVTGHFMHFIENFWSWLKFQQRWKEAQSKIQSGRKTFEQITFKIVDAKGISYTTWFTDVGWFLDEGPTIYSSLFFPCKLSLNVIDANKTNKNYQKFITKSRKFVENTSKATASD